MAIVLENTSVSSNEANTTGYNWSHTIDGDANVLVVVVISSDSSESDRDVTGVTWGSGGPSLTAGPIYNTAGAGLNCTFEFWYAECNGATSISGTDNIYVTMQGTTTDSVAAAYDLSGVDTADIIEANDTANTSGTGTISVTPATGDFNIGAIYWTQRDPADIAITSGEQDHITDFGNETVVHAHNNTNGTITSTDADSSDAAGIAVSFNESSGEPPASVATVLSDNFMLMGIGN